MQTQCFKDCAGMKSQRDLVKTAAETGCDALQSCLVLEFSVQIFRVTKTILCISFSLRLVFVAISLYLFIISLYFLSYYEIRKACKSVIGGGSDFFFREAIGRKRHLVVRDYLRP